MDDVFVLPASTDKSLLSKAQALEKGARELRRLGPWDLGIALPNSFSSGWLLARAGVKKRRGYQTDGRSFLLNQGQVWGRALLHRADAYLKLLPEAVLPFRSSTDFWGIPAANELDPSIPGVVESFDAENEWPDADPVTPPSGPFWVLAPGATAESRRWPIEFFRELARRVVQGTGWPGIIVGGLAEVGLGIELTRDSSLKLLDWTAKGSVGSYWKVFRQARFSVCNESGIAHVASLCGSPVQIVCGAANPQRTAPLGPGKVQIAFNPVDCWPCERNTCGQVASRKLDCLKGIQPEAIWNDIKNGIRI